MSAQVGLWIDHRKAVAVTITNNKAVVEQIDSDVEKQLRRSGDSPQKEPFESQNVPADDSQLRAFTAHLNIYYDTVIARIHNADSILIFGPGEAKGELKNRLEEKGLGACIVAIETTDKMTDPQIAEKVQKHFEK